MQKEEKRYVFYNFKELIMYDLTDKIVLVTGSSSGIGRATAIGFAKEWAKVIVHYNSNNVWAQETLELIQNSGWVWIILQADITNRSQIDSLFSKIKKQYGTIDVLINNAGWIGPYGDFTTVDFDAVDKVIQSNLLWPMYCSQHALKIFKKQNKKWVILFTSSVHDAKHGWEKEAIPYCVSKAWISTMTELLSRAAAPMVRVNAISPWPVLTEVWANDTQETIDYFSERCLIWRRVAVEEIAEGFIFLAKNEWMTWSVVYIDWWFKA